ncbi:protein NRT1/ PTR FAMILY 5.13-like isoform X2 [Rosa rugosa]|uniref:protein NRT1/ PTR FAMILY 5.13-like isoform X2 n=1 Tax=Rosa rugosa TaxID=74645 RepID=UPI002B417DCA|nr:protein NRT1/ PTR FAMILY 5.13-like isoform X2 [Rosa rugosa]
MANSYYESPATQTPLLLDDDVVEAAVDYQGHPVLRSTTGGWRSASFIIGVEIAERVAYYGIASNLISYLTGPLGQSTATAAQNINVWDGTASLLTLLGAFLADSYLGRYRTIVVASLLYILGLGLLTLSALLPFLSASDCETTNQSTSCSSRLQELLFFFSIYLVAVGQGGHKPCVQAFGADQFDGQDPEECKAKSSFFNWWYFGICAGPLCTFSLLAYIQDNLSWGLGFGIPCIVMVLALSIFLLGTRTYRYSVKGDEESPFVRIGKVFVVSLRNWRTCSSAIASEEESRGILPHQSSEQFKFLNKALLAPDDLKGNGKVCTVVEVEEAKSILRLFPIWATCLAYAIVFAQFSTFFTKQGATMNRTIVPALVEMTRLQTAKDYGLVDNPSATVPMSIWWLAPQYLLMGLADVFTMVGLQEFFYDQVPTELRSVGLALYLSIFGVGSFFSSFLISAIEKATSGMGQDSWFSNNLNRAHLDYFYWLLAGLSVVELAIFVYFAKSYIYNRRGTI